MENSQEYSGELHSLQITSSGFNEDVAVPFIAVGTKMCKLHIQVRYIYNTDHSHSPELKYSNDRAMLLCLFSY